MKKTLLVLSLLLLSVTMFAQAPKAPTMDQTKASNTTAKIKLKVIKVGTALGAAAHTVSLAWNNPAPPPALTGSNVYRATVSGGPYTKIFGSPSVISVYTDSTVAGGTTYFYVVTVVAAGANPPESPFSNQVSAPVPSDQPGPPTGLTVTSVN